MRLIDADALIKVLKDRATNEAIAGYMTAYDVTNSIIDEIDEQPTAYDVEKVVAELKEEKLSSNYEIEGIIPRKGFVKGIDTAIDIVRKGGVQDE